MNKIITILIIILTLALTSCSQDVDTGTEELEKEIISKKTEGMSEEDSVKENYEYEKRDDLSFDIVSQKSKSNNIKLINSTDNINRRFYSPDGKNYIKENIKYMFTEIGYLNYREYYLNDQEKPFLVDSGALFLLTEKNLLPNPVWISDNKVIVSNFSRQYEQHAKLIEITENSETKIIDYINYYSANLSPQKDKIALNGHVSKVYIYDINDNTSTIIYKTNYEYSRPKMHLNIAWGINNYIYIDDMHLEENSEDHEKPIQVYSIKKYDIDSDKISDFIEQGYIVNISPNNRYLVYVDEIKNKTVILDLFSEQKFEIPLSTELEWVSDSEGFYYIPFEQDGKIYYEKLTPLGREITDYDFSQFIKDDQMMLNLRYDIELGWLFDVATYHYEKYDQFGNLQGNIYDKFDTYSISTQ